MEKESIWFCKALVYMNKLQSAHVKGSFRECSTSCAEKGTVYKLVD